MTVCAASISVGFFYAFILSMTFYFIVWYCNLYLLLYDWRECVVKVLSTAKHSCAIILTFGNAVVFCCIVFPLVQLH